MTGRYDIPSVSTPIRSIPWDSSWPESVEGDSRDLLFSYLETRKCNLTWLAKNFDEPWDYSASVKGTFLGKNFIPFLHEASYWSVDVNGSLHQNIVWAYPDPIPEMPKIKDLLAFYNEKLDIYVDGVLQERPHTYWS